MPLERAAVALEWLSARHFVILVTVLLVLIESKRTAIGVRTGDELLRTLHDSPAQRQANLFKLPRTQYLHQHANRVGLVAPLPAAALKLQYVNIGPGFRDMQVLDCGDCPIDQAVMAENA